MLWKWANTGKQIYILDLDGTLMPSAGIDNECFWQAVFSCFGDRDSLPEPGEFRHVTDSGILDEWCTRELGRSASVEETRQIRLRFLQLLNSASIRQPSHFSPLPGVVNWLEAVYENSNVYAGIATGGWGHSARLKLELSGLDRFDLSLASSDDAISRTKIMQIAAQKTLLNQPKDNPVITYVGDGTWDLQASQTLNWNFIGIASGVRAAELKQAGAVCILDDFCKSRSDQSKPILEV
jgi:phosphoglycolate phosphatase-like HAD superfamily hydrolase